MLQDEIFRLPKKPAPTPERTGAPFERQDELINVFRDALHMYLDTADWYHLCCSCKAFFEEIGDTGLTYFVNGLRHLWMERMSYDLFVDFTGNRLSQLRALEWLHLQGPTRDITAQLQSLNPCKLVQLDSKVSYELAGKLAQLPHLEELSLSNCRIEIMDVPKTLKVLKLCDISSFGTHIGDVGGLPELTTLHFSYTQFVQSRHKDTRFLALVSQVCNLQSLRLSGLIFGDGHVFSKMNLQHIQFLDLNCIRFHTQKLPELPKLVSLRLTYVNCTVLHNDTVSNWLARLQTLEELSIACVPCLVVASACTLRKLRKFTYSQYTILPSLQIDTERFHLQTPPVVCFPALESLELEYADYIPLNILRQISTLRTLRIRYGSMETAPNDSNVTSVIYLDDAK